MILHALAIQIRAQSRRACESVCETEEGASVCAMSGVRSAREWVRVLSSTGDTHVACEESGSDEVRARICSVGHK